MQPHDNGQSLELGNRASAVPLRPWARPVVTRIELARTMIDNGSVTDGSTGSSIS